MRLSPTERKRLTRHINSPYIQHAFHSPLINRYAAITRHIPYFHSRKMLSRPHSYNPLPKQNPASIAPSMTVTHPENSYRVVNKAGVNKFSTGYSELAMNEAIQSLNHNRTRRETQEKAAATTSLHSISAPIKIPSYTIFELEGQISLADSSNCNMIENSDQSSGNTFINIIGHGMAILEGNKANQSSGRGIEIDNNNADQTPSFCVGIENIEIRDTDDDHVQILLNSGDVAHLQNIVTKQDGAGGGKGLSLNFSDSCILACKINAPEENIVISDNSNFIGDLQVSDSYFGGASYQPYQMLLQGVRRSQFTNCIVDNMVYNAVGLLESGASYPEQECYDVGFHNCHFTYAALIDSDDTYNGVVLEDDANHNRFIGCYFGRKERQDAQTNDWSYGWTEDTGGSTAYNLLLACVFDPDLATGQVNTRTGSNTVSDHHIIA